MADLDRIGHEILRILQRDGDCPHAKIAEQVKVTTSTVSRRIEALKEKGYINGYRATLDRDLLGLGATVFTFVSLKNHGDGELRKFEEEIGAAMPNVIECSRLCGTWDYLLKVVARDMTHYGEIQQKLTESLRVRLVRSFAVMGPEQWKPLPVG